MQAMRSGAVSAGPQSAVLPQGLGPWNIQLFAAGDKECTKDADCDIRNSTCQEGVCRCVQGGVVTSDMTRCLPVATGYGSPCEDAAQCSGRLRSGGICSDLKICQCAEGFHYEKGRCWLSAGLGETCSRNERCYANHDAEAFVCDSSSCRCAPGFYQREYSSCRRKSSVPGEECGIKVDCQFQGAICEQRVCACPKDTTFDQNKKACVSKVSAYMAGTIPSRRKDFYFNWEVHEYGHFPSSVQTLSQQKDSASKACETDKDCASVKHSTCISKQCVCDPGYFSMSSDNVCSPELLQTCTADDDCRVPESTCRSTVSEKVCSCKAGFVASEDLRTCRKATRFINWSCLHQEQCLYFGPNCECRDKKCNCKEGSHWEEEKQYCWRSIAIGGNCSSIEDCRGLKSGTENVDCVTGVCSCAKGYHSSADKMACRKDAENIGDPCEETDDCAFSHSACLDKKCACSPEYYPSDVDSGKICVPGINGDCSSDSDCRLGSSSCVNGKCRCQKGFVSSNSTKECLAEVHEYEGVCEDSVQCSATASLCRGGKCLCSDDTHFRDGRCRTKKGLGSSCIRSSECFLEAASERIECRNGLCQCKYDFYNPLKQECTVSSAGEAGFVAIGSLVFWTIVTREFQLECTVVKASAPGCNSASSERHRAVLSQAVRTGLAPRCAPWCGCTRERCWNALF